MFTTKKLLIDVQKAVKNNWIKGLSDEFEREFYRLHRHNSRSFLNGSSHIQNALNVNDCVSSIFYCIYYNSSIFNHNQLHDILRLLLIFKLKCSIDMKMHICILLSSKAALKALEDHKKIFFCSHVEIKIQIGVYIKKEKLLMLFQKKI